MRNREFKSSDGVDCQIHVEDGRVFISAHNHEIQINISQESISAEITKGNEILDDAAVEIERE